MNRIEVLLKDLARLEGENFPPDNRDLSSRLRVPAPSRTFGVHDEVAKSRNLDFLPFFQAAFDDLERGLDDIGCVLLGKTDLLIDAGDDICLCHFRPLSFPTPSSVTL